MALEYEPDNFTYVREQEVIHDDTSTWKGSLA